MSTEASSLSPADDNKVWFACSAGLILALLFRCVFNFSWPINHDCAMYVAAGQLVLEGKVPYVDFVDLNPPLIFYLSAIPAWFNQNTHIDVEKCFALFIWLLSLISWLLAFVVSRRYEGRDFHCVGPILFGLAAFSFITNEWGEFGQRQYIAAISIIPFVLVRWLRALGDKPDCYLSICIGTLLSIGMSLVPQYLIVPLAFEAALRIADLRASLSSASKAILKSIRDPEILSLIMGGIAYGVAFLLLPTAAKDAFLNRWMPLTMRGYAAYNANWDALTIFPFIIGCFPLCIIAAFLSRRNRCTLTIPLACFCVAAYVAAFVQLKGWYNHYLPLLAGSILYLCVQTAVWMNGKKSFNSVWAKVAASILLLLLCTAPSILLRFSFTYPHGELDTIKRETKHGDSVMVLSTSVPDTYPAVLLSGCTNASRYLFYFPIEMLRFEEKSAKSSALRAQAVSEQRRVLNEIEQDIDRAKPKLIIIPTGKSEDEKKNSMMTYFQQLGLLNKIKVDYSSIGETSGRKSIFQVFKRNAI